MRLEFENTATFITAFNADGSCAIRCIFGHTDCGYDESLDAFVLRHGGAEATAEYLKACHQAN